VSLSGRKFLITAATGSGAILSSPHGVAAPYQVSVKLDARTLSQPSRRWRFAFERGTPKLWLGCGVSGVHKLPHFGSLLVDFCLVMRLELLKGLELLLRMVLLSGVDIVLT
jgi:hypothetical protein